MGFRNLMSQLWHFSILSCVILFFSACDPDVFSNCSTKLEFVLDNKVENLKPAYTLGDTITITGIFSDTLLDRLSQISYKINRPNYFYDVGMIRLDTFGGFSAFKDFEVFVLIGQLYPVDLSEPEGSNIYGDSGVYNVTTEKIGQYHKFQYRIIPKIKGVFWVYFLSDLYFNNISYNYVSNCQEVANMFTNTNNQLNNGWDIFNSYAPFNESVGNPSKQEFDDIGSIVFEVK